MPVEKVKIPMSNMTLFTISCGVVKPCFQKHKVCKMGGNMRPTATPQNDPTNAMKLSSCGIQIARIP